LEVVEQFFWWFCDDYVELVKSRAYKGQGESGMASALAALRSSLDTIHRLFAPFLPFVSDEVWNWWQQGSVHSQPWPAAGAGGDASMLEPVSEVLATIRRAKTEAKSSQKATVTLAIVEGPADVLALVKTAQADLGDAGSVVEFRWVEADALSCTVSLAPAEPAPS
jgi:valyl-tRNA synthetase